jgi:alpha-galactosidase
MFVNKGIPVPLSFLASDSKSLPFSLNPRGFVFRSANALVNLVHGKEEYTASGAMLMEGLRLENQFLGTGYHPRLRALGDFGSEIYSIEKIKGDK